MFHRPLSNITKHWKLLLLLGIATALVVSLITLIFPREYRADADVLIISKSRYGVDPYTVVKSAERIGENVAQVMQTNDFFEKVMSQPGYSIDQARFQYIPERKKRKRWNKALQPSIVYGTGVLHISAYSLQPDQAAQLAGASADALVTHGWEYVGGDVSMKIVNPPVVTQWPVRPNIIMNGIAAFFISIGLMGAVIARK